MNRLFTAEDAESAEASQRKAEGIESNRKNCCLFTKRNCCLHLKLSGKKFGLLIHFHVLRLNNGYKRIANASAFSAVNNSVFGA